jgi:hypothetical protein
LFRTFIAEVVLLAGVDAFQCGGAPPRPRASVGTPPALYTSERPPQQRLKRCVALPRLRRGRAGCVRVRSALDGGGEPGASYWKSKYVELLAAFKEGAAERKEERKVGAAAADAAAAALAASSASNLATLAKMTGMLENEICELKGDKLRSEIEKYAVINLRVSLEIAVSHAGVMFR